MDYDRYQALLVEKDGNILTITVNRPQAKNAINHDLHEEFSRIFDDVDRDESVDVVILAGSGGAFCAGGDLKWLLSLHGDAAATSIGIRRDRKIQNAMLDLEKPIIAKVDGPAIGLGCSLALYCDFIYASEQSVFADPHVSVGLVAGDGGAVMWPQLIGYARARRYLLTGDPITATDAAAIGLITEAVPADKLDETVATMAKRLAKGATHSIKWTKASINAGLKVTANAIIDRAAAFENVTQLLDDHRIALEAFQNRQKPQFTGR
ncbi:enoyl-CoA hydratase/isomerase family protein [Sphingomonas colocasiae]|uniref:Enoyl-CoA hydratase/isomerase family protein n=1 Tax=Sphingomonas colocasiae TaxID=1848973 RepID=A0ABS7PMT6_9SPHN|nr:enoyl-CoA hydratase/isomerase family protein [Sphingomonas colocasiae]MBY8821762.1 enoyl-CoA hydratase/isomerase family protein [Sphingomonas colocasiae]